MTLLLEGLVLEMVFRQSLGMCVCLVMAAGCRHAEATLFF